MLSNLHQQAAEIAVPGLGDTELRILVAGLIPSRHQTQAGAYLIVRMSWVYSLRRTCFGTKVLRWALEKETLRIVKDQVSHPTWARILAGATALLIAKAPGENFAWLAERKSVFNPAGSGFASRFAWAVRILKLASRAQKQVIEEPLPAARLLFSALDCKFFQNTFGPGLPTWEVGLRNASKSSYH